MSDTAKPGAVECASDPRTPLRRRLRLLKLVCRIAITLVVIGAAVVGVIVYRDVRCYSAPYVIKLDDLLAYTEMPSYRQGDSIPLFIHTTQRARAQLFRLADVLVDTGVALDVDATVQSPVYDPFNGLDWIETARLSTRGLPSGYYCLQRSA